MNAHKAGYPPQRPPAVAAPSPERLWRVGDYRGQAKRLAPAFGRQVFCCLEDDDKQNSFKGQSCFEDGYPHDTY